MALGTWARKRSAESQEEDGSQSASVASDESDSPSSATSESFDDDKHHLPVDHRPFMLLPGWDKPPPPPPAPPTDSGDSESASEEAEEKGEKAESSDTDSEEPTQPPQPPPPQDGFNCRWCRYYRAHGNGTASCASPDYQRWSGTDKLVETKSKRPVLNPERACSDWYEPAVPAPGAKQPSTPNRTKPEALGP